jgi:hypothetical protein
VCVCGGGGGRNQSVATPDAVDRRQITDILPRIVPSIPRIVVPAFTVDLNHINNVTEIKLLRHS